MRETAKEQMKGIRRLLSGDVVMARAALPEAHRENYARTGRKYLRCERELEPVGGCDPWMVPGAGIGPNPYLFTLTGWRPEGNCNFSFVSSSNEPHWVGTVGSN